jgi:hypothetical protein
MQDKKRLLQFLDVQMPTYDNPMGVHIYMNTDRTLFVCSDFPGVDVPPNVSLELFQEVKSMGRLITFLGITTIEQLLKLSPTDLLELYKCGRMDVICSLESPIEHEICFSKFTKGTLITVDLHEMHELVFHFDKPEEYIDFTFKYFKVQRDRGNTPPISTNKPRNK